MDIKNTVTKINDYIALNTTLAMSTMWCVYAFTVLVMIPLFVPATTTFIQFLSSSMIQLIALPMIMVGNNILNAKTEARAQQDHEMLMAELEEIKEMHAELKLVFKKGEEPEITEPLA